MAVHKKESLQGLRVLSLESRRATEMAELIRRYDGEPLVAPSMREVPLDENRAVLDFLFELESQQFDIFILMTGVGTRALNQVLLSAYPQERIVAALRQVQLIARGPKPVAALKELGLEAAIIVGEPNTWREVLAALDKDMTVAGKHIAIQEYGIANAELVSALEQRGATVKTIAVYRWALPEDLTPLRNAIETICECNADVVLFTNGAQADHLFRIASQQNAADKLRAACKRIVIGSVGPICTQVLQEFGLSPDVQPERPKMGSLMADMARRAGDILAAKRASAAG